MTEDKLWWTVFTVALFATATAETFLPLRSFSSSTTRRWINNSLLVAVCTLALEAAHQLAGIILAFSVQASHWGLFNIIPIPYWSQVIIGFAALDLTAYLVHRLHHGTAILWRAHQVHHSETDIDFMSGFRFHPIEVLVNHGGRFICIALLGVPPLAVFASVLAGITANFYAHANARVPEPIDRFFRLLLVTPFMHWMHHADELPRQNANFGAVFSFWDRAFKTYQPSPAPSEPRLQPGLVEMPDGSSISAFTLLLLPFKPLPASSEAEAPSTPSAYPNQEVSRAVQPQPR